MNSSQQAPSPDEQLLSLSREMLSIAEASDWEKLAEMEKVRLPLFQQVFEHGVADKLDLAREVLSIDNITRSLAEAGMPVLQQEILDIQNSGKASSVYQAVQGYAAKNR